MSEKIISSTKPHKVSLDNEQKIAARPRIRRATEPRLNSEQDRLIRVSPSAGPLVGDARPVGAGTTPSADRQPLTGTPEQIARPNQEPLLSAAVAKRISSLKEANQRLRRQTEMLSRTRPVNIQAR